MKWNLENSQPIVSTINAVANKFGMSAALGGSVIHKKESSNDLDLVIFNLKTSIKPNHSEFMVEFISLMDLSLAGAVDHSLLGDTKLVYKLKTKNGMNIDLLFPNLDFSDRLKDCKVLARKTQYNKQNGHS